MAASMMASSLSLKPAPLTVEKSAGRGLPTLARRTSSFKVVASGGKKIKTDKPYESKPCCWRSYCCYSSFTIPPDCCELELDKSALQGELKLGVRIFRIENLHRRSSKDEWSPTGDVYVGGATGLAIWVVTLVGILAGGALLVYNTSALAQ